MEGDAGILGIRQPATVRITQEGNAEDWPFETIRIFPDRVAVIDPHYLNKVVAYEYVTFHRQQGDSWLFVGPDGDFTVEPGPAHEPSTNGHPVEDDWP